MEAVDTVEAPHDATPVEYVLDADVGTKSWQGRVRSRARNLANQVEMGYLELGEILYRIYDAPVDGDPKNGSVLARWGYRTIGEFAEKELNLHEKKAQRLVRIFYRVHVELNGFDNPALKQRFIKIGWSKARELVRILTKENAEAWIAAAEGWNYATTLAHVQREVQRQQDEAIQRDIAKQPDPVAESNRLSGEGPISLRRISEPEEQLKWVNKVFALESTQAETVNLALKRAQDLAGNLKKSPGTLLSLICLDFLSGADWQGNDQQSKLRFLAKIEQAIGLRLVVVDDADDVVFGMRALEAAALKLREDALEQTETTSGDAN